MITKTDALVLKSMRYRDTSKIVTFYTRRYGKLKAIAKGARDSKSKFGASLEPMTLSSLVLYKKEYRELQLISQCDIVKPYKRLHSEMARMAVGLSVLELVNQLTHDEEENLALFSLLGDTFDTLELTEGNCTNLLYAFELRFAALFGFGLHLERCLKCKNALTVYGTGSTVIFDIAKGGLHCQDCANERGRGDVQSGSRYRVSVQSAALLNQFLHAPLEKISSLKSPEATGNELDKVLRLYLQYHFEDWKPLKSAKVFEKVMG